MHEATRSADWRSLCELATKEHDPDRLMELIKRLNEALDRTIKGMQEARSMQ
jgi:hypothetical protein